LQNSILHFTACQCECVRDLDEDGSQLEVGDVFEGDQGQTASDGADSRPGGQEVPDGFAEAGQAVAASPVRLHHQHTNEAERAALGQRVVDGRRQMFARAIERATAAHLPRQ